jgi:hypothetical protein
MGEEFLIYRIEVDDNNVFRNKFYLKSKCDKKSFSVESQELINLFELKQPKDPINGKIKESEKQAPEFWYVDINEEKDSELLPTFKEWFSKKVEFRMSFDYSYYGYSNRGNYDGYDWVTYTRGWEGNSDKMQKITLNEWDTWFNK